MVDFKTSIFENFEWFKNILEHELKFKKNLKNEISLFFRQVR